MQEWLMSSAADIALPASRERIVSEEPTSKIFQANKKPKARMSKMLRELFAGVI